MTEKVIKKIGNYRATLMAGITQPLNNPTILGSKVKYGTNLSYMAALEHTVGFSDLWIGARIQGLHAFETRIDGIALGNALTTLDVVPELRYYFKRNSSVCLAVVIPVITDYELSTGSDTRVVAANVGISTRF